MAGRSLFCSEIEATDSPSGVESAPVLAVSSVIAAQPANIASEVHAAVIANRFILAFSVMIVVAETGARGYSTAPVSGEVKTTPAEPFLVRQGDNRGLRLTSRQTGTALFQ